MQHEPEIVLSVGGTAPILTTAIVSIVVGVVVVAVANGLLRGKSGSRLVVTIVEMLSLSASIFTAFVAPAPF